jgi:hypothetical protein
MNTLRLSSMMTLAAAMLLCGSLARAAELPLLLKEDFEQGASRWQPFDEKSWQVLDTPAGKVYGLVADSKYQPPYRSPVNVSLLKDIVVGDFVLECRVQSTVKDYDHRSLVLVFGYQDPSHFYYVHFGKKTDNHANQIFLVDGAPRVKISTETTPGTRWDDAWHQVKIARDASDGSIEVYFDDMKRPVMEAVDDTFRWGQIGLGAFDDLGNFDNLTLRGTLVKPPHSAAK